MHVSVEETPLAHACGHGNLQMAKLLIEYGANINRLCAVSSCHSFAYWDLMTALFTAGDCPSSRVRNHLPAVTYGQVSDWSGTF